MELKDSYILVAGFAQLPKGTPVFEMQKSIGCILVIDKETDIIVDCTFTFIRDLTNEFISSLIRGKSIIQDLDEIINEVARRFIVPPKKAVIQAILSARNRYIENKES
ncbi:DUF3870 domain-containing protein [Geobacillus sp. MR]|jgi:hypothetical protein|uniref:DUF3870 domain-containing protein n=1 Tax=Geobacillus sp. MR TaxID=2508875 RepID=UPI00148BD0E0|nr:DUF3870 domain-containing protein [Geobacillus sp. MR]NNU88095.1 DUF3870 domain-containing protein [Geobacillus sp. MR]